MYIAIVVACVLFAVSLLHFLWASGSPWPCTDQQSLLRTVVGHPDLNRFPSPLLTVLAAMAIGIAGLIALWAGGILLLPLPGWIRTAGVIILICIFLLRGLSTYTPKRIWTAPIEPFATLDRRYFAPLCIVLGCGFIWLLIADLAM
ncbi:MAG: DUF3995 domain-containing protein [Hyphomicrobiales bacterium]|nr:DUF3995 domain-containing protein [Hyphomicrobiales bacterium]MCP4999281.1 DUF3995 domain-containing protein [Hyphomicrobiales bacterium]